jgi:hypothetical protein
MQTHGASTLRRPSPIGARPARLARGREFLAIPGPTNVPEVVLQAMHRPAVDIYAD